MIEIILTSIFIVSITGVGVVLVRRMPQARRTAMSAELGPANLGQAAGTWCLARIRQVPCFRDFNWVEFTQKLLMRGRVLVLKAENKINDYMVKLRQKAEAEQKKDSQVLDNYWHDLKTIVKTKKQVQLTSAKEAIEPEVGQGNLKSTQEPLSAAGDGLPVTINLEQDKPVINRVVMPQDFDEHGQRNSNKKKRLAKRKKFKDPFQW